MADNTLALYMPLDQITNNHTTVPDLSGNNRNGTITGSPLVVPQTMLGACMSFDGKSHFEVSDPFGSPTNDFTISYWLQPNQINSGYQAILGKHESSRKPSMWIGPVNGQIHFDSYDPAGNRYFALLDSFFQAAEQWVHIAWVKEGTQYLLYRNGTLFTTQAAPATLYSNATTTYSIGMVDSYLNGYLADMRIYNQALTAEMIQRDLQSDQATSSAFRMTYPLGFTLLNSDQQPVLSITDDPKGETQTLTVTNVSRQNITFTPPSTTSVSSSNSHLELRFRPTTLATSSLTQISLATAADWQLTTLQQTDGTVSIYLLNTLGLTLPTGQSLSLQLQHIKADGTGGTRGSRAEMRYRQMTYEKDTTALTGSRLSYLSIINQTGQKNIPLHLGFVGTNTILNDNSTGNTVTMRVANISDSDLTLNPATSAAPTHLTISFDVQPQGKNSTDDPFGYSWALTTADYSESITASATDSRNGFWHIGVSAQEFEFTPKSPLTLHPQEYVQLTLGNLITPLPAGPTNIYLDYENFPGYWDGQFVVVLSKSPLVVTQNMLGIGTNTPRTALDTGSGVLSGAANDYQKAQLTLSGGGLITWKNNYLRWTQEFVAISMGNAKALRSSNAIPDGKISFMFPNTIPANPYYGNAARTATADGLLLQGGEALYGVHTIGGGAEAVQYNLVSYTQSFNAPSNWLLIALAGAPDRSVKLGIGAILAQNSSINNGSIFPTGLIQLWSGAASNIPLGWALCDGTNHTPDLRGRFLVGAGGTGYPDQPGSSGNATQHAHTVTISGQGGTNSSGVHPHAVPSGWYDRGALDDVAAAGKKSYNAIDRGDASVVGALTSSDGIHAHTVTLNSSNATTSTSTDNNRPAWYALCYIIKL